MVILRFLTTPFGRLRLIGLIEGITLLALLLFGIPLKYFGGISEVSRILGSLHGIAFIIYAAMLLSILSSGGWSRREIIYMVFVTIVPFGIFYNDRILRTKLQASRNV